MTVAPDLAGYIDAQLRKRAALGSEVNFHFPSTLVWPDGTVLDPDTGRPYDPLIEPESSSGRGVESMTLSVAFRPNFQEDTSEAAIGDIKNNVALIWVTVEEFSSPPSCITLATSFDYAGDNYLIRKTTEESIGGQPWRVLIWGERQTEGNAV